MPFLRRAILARQIYVSRIVKSKPPKSTIDLAAAGLRDLAKSTEEGTLVGSEEELLGKLQVSRATLRQAARLLEVEGLLKVRRGIHGGYFAARPDAGTIARTVGSFLDLGNVSYEDLTQIASVLWIEVVRKAATSHSRESKALVVALLQKVEALTEKSTFDHALAVEAESRTTLFRLINSPYIELIFQINIAFAEERFPYPADRNDMRKQKSFVRAWRSAKILELEAIRDGDRVLAVMAARHARNLWHRRLWDHAADL